MGAFLVVDCDARNTERLRIQLVELGHTVFVPRDPAEAPVLASNELSAVFVDLAMPRLDVPKLVGELRARCQAPFVACVRQMRRADVVFAIRDGFADWLEKPVSAEQLNEVLGRLEGRAPAPPAKKTVEGRAPTGDLLKDVIQMIRDGSITIPPMPQVATRLRALLAGANPEPLQVVHLIESDPGLAAKVVAMAGSPAFGGGLERPTVAAAVARLGTRHLQSLVETSVVANLFPASDRALADAIRAHWRRAVATACLAREVAQATGRLDANEAYLLALFQDVGEVFLLTILAKQTGGMPGPGATELIDQWHGQFGASLVAKWGLPAEFADVAKNHHEASYEGESARSLRLHAVNLASRLVDIHAADATRPVRGPATEASLAAVGLNAADQSGLMARLPAIQSGVVALLG